MIAPQTKIHVAAGGVREASLLKEGIVVKTPKGNKKISEVKMGEDFVSKFIFSDGYKCLLSDAQHLMTPEMTWTPVSRIKEGMVFRTHGEAYVKVIDITPLGRQECISIVVEDDGSYVLANGMPTK